MSGIETKRDREQGEARRSPALYHALALQQV